MLKGNVQEYWKTIPFQVMSMIICEISQFLFQSIFWFFISSLMFKYFTAHAYIGREWDLIWDTPLKTYIEREAKEKDIFCICIHKCVIHPWICNRSFSSAVLEVNKPTRNREGGRLDWRDIDLLNGSIRIKNQYSHFFALSISYISRLFQISKLRINHHRKKFDVDVNITYDACDIWCTKPFKQLSLH